MVVFPAAAAADK
jgi:hypothetical protein